MANAKSKTHRLTITVTLDKPCGVKHASAVAKACLEGSYNIPPAIADGDSEIVVKSVTMQTRR